MSLSDQNSVDDVHDSLSPSDREEFSLFLRYPELGIDEIDGERDAPKGTGSKDIIREETLESSPLSPTCSTSLKDRDLAKTVSTAQTTPSRLFLTGGDTVEFGGWNEYIYLMQQSNLPQECLQYLTSLGQTIVNIGTILHSTLRPNQPSSVVKIGRWFLQSIRCSSGQVWHQIEAIEQLIQLAAFNVKPEETQIWSVYRQRTKLIARNISLPSKRELGLIESLTLLYNAYVYHPFLQLHLSAVSQHGIQTKTVINEIYDNLTAWLENYKQWGKGMIRLRTEYLQPLVQEMARSEVARDELADFQHRIKKAKTAQLRPTDKDWDRASEQMVDKLNLSARRPGGGGIPIKRTRSRYKREHTI